MKRFLGFVIAAALVATPAQAQYVLNLRDADVRAFIEDAARVTGRTFIMDAAVQGKVSVVTERPLSRSEYFELFLATLRANGLVAVPIAGGAFRIQPVATAATSASRVRTGSPNGFITEIFRLRSIEGPAAAEAVRPLVSREGSVTSSRNSVVVADFADNVARIRAIIASIDRDTSSARIVPLQNAGAREIAAALAALGGEGGRVSVVPIDSSNAIAIRGDAATVQNFVEIARDLDVRAASGTEVRVIFLEHADAEQILPVIQQLLGQSSSGPTTSGITRPATRSTSTGSSGTDSPPLQAPAPVASVSSGGGSGASVFGGRPAVVTRFEGANAIVIAAPTELQRQLGEVVRQLDTRQQQVLVEAVIVEISETAANRLGVQLLLAGLEGSNIPFAVTNYSNASPPILDIAAPILAREIGLSGNDDDGDDGDDDTPSGGISDALNERALTALGASGSFAGLAVRSGNAILGAIVNAVKSDSNSNLLATPSVMTLNNREAHFLAGQEIPVTTGEALSDNFDNAFRTVQRQNVGITLDVRPQVNASGAIRLDIRQEVSSIAGPVSTNSADLIVNKREIESTITVQDGEIAALGGLLNDNERRTIERIPFLGDIPVIGNLFKSKGRQREKTNLMVFIRPTIMRNADDTRAMTARRYDTIRNQQLIGNPNVEPSIDQLVRDYMGTVPPRVVPQQPSDLVIAPVPIPPSEVPRQ